MTSPLVSVCIPAFNCSPFIYETLNSVLNQSLQDFEVIIQENASTDNTLCIIEQFINKAKDFRFVLYRNEVTLSADKNWNLASSKAKGKYIKILCADDLIDPDCLEKQVAILDRSSPNVVLTCSQRRVIGIQGNIIIRNWNLKKQSGLVPGKVLIRQCARAGTNLIGEPCAVLMKTSAFRKTAGFNTQIPYFIDLDMWIRILEQGNAYIDPNVLCSFRVSKGSWSAQIINEHAKQARQFVALMQQRYPHWVSTFDRMTGWISGSLLGYLRALFFVFSDFLSNRHE
jgi:glycosyltransferase involved in cell wall biosynthesis